MLPNATSEGWAVSRFYGYLWERSDSLSLAMLPRVRLTVGSSIGIGLQWMTAWFHVWLRTSEGRPHDTTMIELLPHVWFHWNRKWGAGMHIWWLTWKVHWWLYRRETQ